MHTHRLAAAIAALAPAPALACASCGCTFTSDWLTQGLITQPGQALTLRYDYVPQTELRSSTDRVDSAAIALPTTREIERRTDNHYVTLAYDRQFASDWGVSVALPFVARPHRTVSTGDVDESSSHSSGLGDLRATVRWQGLSTPSGVTGLQLGVVVPTGAFHRTFVSGPQSGQPVDRGLQPGSGTTQMVIGGYHYRRLSSTLAISLQAQVQIPLNAREDYRPGVTYEASAALQWLGWRLAVPTLQVNFRANARDSGLNADVENSGGEQVMLAPGLSAPVSSRLSLFGLVQVPIYRRVGGYQLTPPAVFSTGLQYRF